jgi:hypothetical protein
MMKADKIPSQILAGLGNPIIQQETGARMQGQIVTVSQ